jgi:hypothetical protein
VRHILVATIAALLAACAVSLQLGGPNELFGDWRLSGASQPLPEDCADTTLTFHPDGSFDGRSGTLVTHGRYFTSARKHDYWLRLERREFSGGENCQGITARAMASHGMSDLDLAFERDGREFRLTAPIVRGAYILYTREN